MKGFKQISCTLVVIILFVDIAVSVPLVRVKRQDLELENDAAVDLNPIVSEDATSEGLDREKRKLPDAKFATKNAIIGFVFSGSKASGLSGQPTRVPLKTTTDDTPDFDRNKVSLDIPDELFGNSFTTVTRVSQIFGDLIMNSARRYAQFIQYFKPAFGKVLIVKGVNIVPTTTTTTESSV